MSERMTDGKTGGKNKKAKKKVDKFTQRKRTIGSLIILVAAVMVIIMTVRYALDYIDFSKILSGDDEVVERYPNMHNASRYFFRVYYPDNWNVEAEAYGFLLDSEDGLVLELYPLIRIVDPTASPLPSGATLAPGTPTPTPTLTPTPNPSATIDRLAGMIRDTSLTVSFYYREYTEEQWLEANATADPTADPSETLNPATQETASSGTATSARTAGANTSNTPVPQASGATPVPTPNTNLSMLDLIAEDVYTSMTAGFAETVEYDELEYVDTTDIIFKRFTYSYEAEDGISHTADCYIAVRASNYCIIVYDGVSEAGDNAYRSYRNEFLSILEEFRFSVFED